MRPPVPVIDPRPIAPLHRAIPKPLSVKIADRRRHARLLLIRARQPQLRRRRPHPNRRRSLRQRLPAPLQPPNQRARRIHPVVQPRIMLPAQILRPKHNVPARLPPERDPLRPHPPPKQRIARRRNPRIPPVRPHILHRAARRLRIQQHRRPRPTLQQPTRQQRRQPVRLIAVAPMIHHPDPIPVRIPRNPQIQPQRRHRPRQIHHRRRLLRIRNMRPPRHHRVMNRMHPLRNSRQRRRPRAAHHPVARIHRYPQPRSSKPLRQHPQIIPRNIPLPPPPPRNRRNTTPRPVRK